MLHAFLAALIATAIAAAARGESITIDAVVLRPMIEAEVPAQQTGVLAKIFVDEGGAVEAGQALATLDDRAAKLAVQQASLEREQALAKANNQLRIQYADKALEVARAEIERSAESNQQFPNSISRSQLDVERLTAEKLALERRQAEHDMALERFALRLKETSLEAAQLQFEMHAVRAPFSGVVALVRARAGEWVQPGAPVVRLIAIDRLRADGFAPADAVAANMAGSKVQFMLDEQDADGASPEPLGGVLRFVSPEIDPVSRQVRVWAELDNRALALRPGQRGRLVISTGETP
ncbi:MAG: HlyD family efflux transporter periplasmic adaptor subunit [Pirellulales bacterium]|nr:HlyD family efflux transporter periplasmic adaptor subunit [Pirellulales bacterium]